MARKGLGRARKMLVFLLALSLLFSNVGFDGFVYADSITESSADTTGNEDKAAKEDAETTENPESAEDASETENILTTEGTEASEESKELPAESQTASEENSLTTQTEIKTSSAEVTQTLPKPSSQYETTSQGNASNTIKNPVSKAPEWWTEKFGEMDKGQIIFQTNVTVSLADEDKKSIGLYENGIELVPYISLEGDKYDLVPANGSNFSVKQDGTVSFRLTPDDFLDSEVIYIGVKAEYPNDSRWYNSDYQDEFLFKASITGSQEGREYPVEVIEELELGEWKYEQSGNHFSVARTIKSSDFAASGWWNQMFPFMKKDGTVLMYTVNFEPRDEDGNFIQDGIDLIPYYGSSYSN